MIDLAIGVFRIAAAVVMVPVLVGALIAGNWPGALVTLAVLSLVCGRPAD